VLIMTLTHLLRQSQHRFILTRYDMIRYLFTAIGFPPGGSDRYTRTKVGKRHLYAKAETIHKTI
jgi:hypothetical protein